MPEFDFSSRGAGSRGAGSHSHATQRDAVDNGKELYMDTLSAPQVEYFRFYVIIQEGDSRVLNISLIKSAFFQLSRILVSGFPKCTF